MKKNITFKVYFLPETVAIEQPSKLVENTEANFTCTSSASNSGVDIIWRYNNNVMAGPDTTASLTQPETQYGGFTTSSYLLMTLTDDHIDGRIKCEARHNNTDKSVFDSIDLDVKYSPKFTSVPGPMSLSEKTLAACFSVTWTQRCARTSCSRHQRQNWMRQLTFSAALCWSVQYDFLCSL